MPNGAPRSYALGMAARAMASLSLTFGLVSIPVKLYSATESSAAIRFKLMGRGGARLKQQYVADRDAGSDADDTEIGSDIDSADDSRAVAPPATAPPAASPGRSAAEPRRLKLVESYAAEPAANAWAEASRPALVERADMVKGYEFEPGRFVLFTPDELAALKGASRQTIDIVSFIPERSVDPIYYDKAYFLAPDKRGARTYSLLLAAMRSSQRCALAKWAWRSKEYVVQIRPGERGMVLQQLLYADEVRSFDELDIELVEVGAAELDLALKLIAQISEDTYDPKRFVDEEKQRILAAVEAKIAGRQVVAPQPAQAGGGEVVDLMAALRASLRSPPKKAPASAAAPAAKPRRRK